MHRKSILCVFVNRHIFRQRNDWTVNGWNTRYKYKIQYTWSSLDCNLKKSYSRAWCFCSCALLVKHRMWQWCCALIETIPSSHVCRNSDARLICKFLIGWIMRPQEADTAFGFLYTMNDISVHIYIYFFFTFLYQFIYQLFGDKITWFFIIIYE